LAVIALYSLPIAYIPNWGLPVEKRVFIGTSLTRFAIPPGATGDALLWDEVSHSRLSFGGSIDSRAHITALLNHSLDAGAEEIYVEVYPFLRRFKSELRLAKKRATLAESAIWRGVVDKDVQKAWFHFGVILREPIRMILGRRTFNKFPMLYPEDVPFLDETGLRVEKQMEQLYPYKVTALEDPESLDSLKPSVARSEEQGAHLAFLAYPISEAAAERLGEPLLAELRSSLTLFERRLKVPVLGSVEVWPNRYFVDNAHMNRAGRERFLKRLADQEARSSPGSSPGSSK